LILLNYKSSIDWPSLTTVRELTSTLAKLNDIEMPLGFVLDLSIDGFKLRTGQHGEQYIKLADQYGATNGTIARFRIDTTKELMKVLQAIAQKIGPDKKIELKHELPDEEDWEKKVLDWTLNINEEIAIDIEFKGRTERIHITDKNAKRIARELKRRAEQSKIEPTAYLPAEMIKWIENQADIWIEKMKNIPKEFGKEELQTKIEQIKKETESKQTEKKETDIVKKATTMTSKSTHGGNNSTGEVKNSPNSYRNGKQSSNSKNNENGNKRSNRSKLTANLISFRNLKRYSNIRNNRKNRNGKSNQVYYGKTNQQGNGSSYYRPTPKGCNDKEWEILHNLLDKFIGKSYGDREGPPEIDKKAIVKAIVSKTGWEYIWKLKEAQGRPRTLISIDVSGSCQGFSQIALAVGEALRNDQCILITGQGWCIDEIYDPKSNSWKPIDTVIAPSRSDSESGTQQYMELVRKFNIEKVLAIGDADGKEAYIKLSRHLPNRVWWLDNWACNYGDPKKGKMENFKGTYVYRCQTASDYIMALEKFILKEDRRCL